MQVRQLRLLHLFSFFAGALHGYTSARTPHVCCTPHHTPDPHLSMSSQDHTNMPDDTQPNIAVELFGCACLLPLLYWIIAPVALLIRALTD